MPHPARLLALIALPLVLSGRPALAQTEAAPLTTAQRASLDRAIRLWTESLSPGSTGFASTVTPEGDHYHLDRKPDLQGMAAGVSLLGGDTTAAVRPAPGGTWQFDDIRASMPLVLSAPAAKGKPALQLTLDMQGQSGHMVIDPSLATPSTIEGAATGATGTINLPPQFAASFHVGAITTHGVWKPVGPGRIDRSSATALGDLAVQVTGQQAISITVDAFHGETRILGLSPDRLADLVTFLRANMPAMAPAHAAAPPAPGAKPTGLTAADRQALHTALDRAREIATGFETDATIEGVAFSGSGHSVRFRQVGIGEALGAPGGRLDAKLRLTFDGLSSSDIPPNVRDFVPHQLLFSPRISGLSVDAVFAALGALIDDGVVDERKPDALQARGAAILAKGPVSIGLDALAFDLGPATLAGSGAVTLAGTRPQDITGTANIEIKGFNALVKRANADPMLHQAAPVLIFLKGIGDEDDTGAVVWKIAYTAGHLLVNGTDMSQMLPTGK